MNHLKQHEFVIWEGWPAFTFYSGSQDAFEATMAGGKRAQEIISMAAVKGLDGTVYVVERPGRHGHVGAYMGKLGVSEIQIPGNTLDQGFLTSHGRYVNRVAGLSIAKAANQLIRKTHPDYELFSEDLW